ncbi:MAG: polyamine aminopropyltransferase [Erysipelotrichaceae bacterium]
MELWYTEEHTKNVRFSIKVKEHLYKYDSNYQRIDVFETTEFGKVLTLDDVIMLTEHDEFIYHEMIVHPALAANPNIKKVLVIGAGDGGTINQLIKYPTISHIDLVEIDEEVVKTAQTYFPSIAKSFEDERVTMNFCDGLKFVRRMNNEYDLIIVDSTDPFGPGEGLFTREFYGNCYKALTAEGILINQHESPYYHDDALAMKQAHSRIKPYFPICKVYQAHIPTYPSGHWLFGYAAKTIHPLNDNINKWNNLHIKTDYYNTELHKGSFALPNYVIKLLEE